MKKFSLSLIIVLSTMVSFAQTQLKKNESPNDNTLNNQTVTYRLFPTQNIWTFIKLNTRNGQMWQIQYSLDKDKRFETYLNILPLVSRDEESNGRFTLYPTTNIYNFILLDQLNGKTWQVQWAMESKDRLIYPIE